MTTADTSKSLAQVVDDKQAVLNLRKLDASPEFESLRQLWAYEKQLVAAKATGVKTSEEALKVCGEISGYFKAVTLLERVLKGQEEGKDE